MGLRRSAGPLQGVTTRDEWELLGYRVEGDFSQASVAAGGEIVIDRDPASCGHPMDDPAFGAGVSREGQLEVLGVKDARAVTAAIVEGVVADIEAGLEPHDILVVFLPGARPGQKALADALDAAGVPAFVAGTDRERSSFRAGPATSRCRTSSVPRATKPGRSMPRDWIRSIPSRCTDADDELVRRNQVFVALSRARLWCVAIGVEGPAIEELRLLRAEPRIRFPAFNQRSLRRRIEHDESPQEQLFQ
ncbi:MAG: hypothetical protein U5R48_10360 [Gammaproteobacteria bacterium]|nr:hypothetical protein [Gammaproteobacteria bacterium]